MKQFQLDRINQIAPYEVKAEGKQYVFDTAQGLRYEVRFFEEQPIGGCETWQFSFAKANSEPAPEDPYVRFTLFAIIDEFFRENEDVLLYVCDTSDDREKSKSQKPWINSRKMGLHTPWRGSRRREIGFHTPWRGSRRREIGIVALQGALAVGKREL